ncbi:MAG: hypothetical protein JNM72_12185 [Deltaproteobacteria bacterium]|nr:hypothetical protein [Deltaproteobacteria bacterium]
MSFRVGGRMPATFFRVTGLPPRVDSAVLRAALVADGAGLHLAPPNAWPDDALSWAGGKPSVSGWRWVGDEDGADLVEAGDWTIWLRTTWSKVVPIEAVDALAWQRGAYELGPDGRQALRAELRAELLKRALPTRRDAPVALNLRTGELLVGAVGKPADAIITALRHVLTAAARDAAGEDVPVALPRWEPSAAGGLIGGDVLGWVADVVQAQEPAVLVARHPHTREPWLAAHLELGSRRFALSVGEDQLQVSGKLVGPTLRAWRQRTVLLGTDAVDGQAGGLAITLADLVSGADVTLTFDEDALLVAVATTDDLDPPNEAGDLSTAFERASAGLLLEVGALAQGRLCADAIWAAARHALTNRPGLTLFPQVPAPMDGAWPVAGVVSIEASAPDLPEARRGQQLLLAPARAPRPIEEAPAAAPAPALAPAADGRGKGKRGAAAPRAEGAPALDHEAAAAEARRLQVRALLTSAPQAVDALVGASGGYDREQVTAALARLVAQKEAARTKDGRYHRTGGAAEDLEAVARAGAAARAEGVLFDEHPEGVTGGALAAWRRGWKAAAPPAPPEPEPDAGEVEQTEAERLAYAAGTQAARAGASSAPPPQLSGAEERAWSTGWRDQAAELEEAARSRAAARAAKARPAPTIARERPSAFALGQQAFRDGVPYADDQVPARLRGADRDAWMAGWYAGKAEVDTEAAQPAAAVGQ